MSKADYFRGLVDEYLDGQPRYMVGWCRECESEVWVDTELAWGPAESCEQHEPLCRLLS